MTYEFVWQVASRRTSTASWLRSKKKLEISHQSVRSYRSCSNSSVCCTFSCESKAINHQSQQYFTNTQHNSIIEHHYQLFHSFGPFIFALINDTALICLVDLPKSPHCKRKSEARLVQDPYPRTVTLATTRTLSSIHCNGMYIIP